MIELIVSKCNITEKPSCKNILNTYNGIKSRLTKPVGVVVELTSLKNNIRRHIFLKVVEAS